MSYTPIDAFPPFDAATSFGEGVDAWLNELERRDAEERRDAIDVLNLQFVPLPGEKLTNPVLRFAYRAGQLGRGFPPLAQKGFDVPPKHEGGFYGRFHAF